jgi:ferredoxin
MAFKIVDCCISCWACEPVCPTGAIYADENSGHFMIDAKQCTKCQGDYADAQCASICPVEGAILNGFGVPVNPPESLTGVPIGHRYETGTEAR